MLITHAEVRNFGSYEHLEFDFSKQGLTLIAGPTGAGKSTLCDIIPWVLFGVTAKNGAADDVKSWFGGQTKGCVELKFPTETIVVFRDRSPNDLYYRRTHNSNDNIIHSQVRGKDLLDTQKRINELLGMDAELYLAGAYFHEFSQTASFFTAPAKVRRLITEQLVDLSLPKTLTTKLADTKKDRKKYAGEVEKMLAEARIHLSNAQTQLADTKNRLVSWECAQALQRNKVRESLKSFEADKARRVKELEALSDTFELQVRTNIILREEEIKDYERNIQDEPALQSELEAIKAEQSKHTDATCSECGAKKDAHTHLVLIKRESDTKAKLTEIANTRRAINVLKQMLRVEHNKENPYLPQVILESCRINTFRDQLEALEQQKNPHLEGELRAAASVKAHHGDVRDLQVIADDLKTELSDLDLLSSVIDSFRGAIVKRAIKDLENKTNALISKHFDAEFRVGFDIATADKLEVSISKDGNECSYSQLSKGQRQLLKLCFGVSVMKVVANHHAVKFDAIFLDEFADGCDENIKAKSFRLLEELALEYSSVFAIDHSEGLKSMFTNRYDVKLVNGRSEVEKAV